MRRIRIAIAALLGFVAGFAATLLIGISQSVKTECDGVCFSELPAIGLAAFAIGVMCAIGFAFVARRLIDGYFVKPS